MHARHHEHLASRIAEKAAHQLARNPPRPAIVDTHIGQPPRSRQVARQRNDRHRAAHLAQCRRDVGVFIRDDDQRVGLLRGAVDGLDDARRLEVIEVGHRADHALRFERLLGDFETLLQIDVIRCNGLLQEDGYAQPAYRYRIECPIDLELARPFEHAPLLLARDTAAAVKHAVDGCFADVGGLGDIGHARFAAVGQVGHEPSRFRNWATGLT